MTKTVIASKTSEEASFFLKIMVRSLSFSLDIDMENPTKRNEEAKLPFFLVIMVPSLPTPLSLSVGRGHGASYSEVLLVSILLKHQAPPKEAKKLPFFPIVISLSLDMEMELENPILRMCFWNPPVTWLRAAFERGNGSPPCLLQAISSREASSRDSLLALSFIPSSSPPPASSALFRLLACLTCAAQLVNKELKRLLFLRGGLEN